MMSAEYHTEPSRLVQILGIGCMFILLVSRLSNSYLTIIVCQPFTGSSHLKHKGQTLANPCSMRV